MVIDSVTLFTLMTFAAVFLTVLALYLGLQEARTSPTAGLKKRLRRLATGQEASPPKESAITLLRVTNRVEKSLSLLPLMGKINKLISQSGVQMTPSSFLAISGAAAVSGLMVAYLCSGQFLASLLAMLLFGTLPTFFLRQRKNQRKIRFEEQFPDTLSMIARSLRAGHSLTGTVELISMEMPEPTGGLFRSAYDQQQLGIRITEALGTLQEKVESIDLHFFVTIVRINYEAGGNLAEILDKLAETVRSRLQVRRQVRTYSAQGRMSGYIIGALPAVVFVAFYFISRDYMSVFFTEKSCKYTLMGAVVGQCIGFLMIRKIVNIRI